MASSSKTASASLSARQWKYDVFLSFRDRDTRKSITYEIYDQLQNKRGIRTFMDDPDLKVGEAVSPTVLRAIEESRFAIVVLSPNYADSRWCLEELTKICQCMEDNNRILPLFYNVNPTDVRYQKMTFKDAFTKHDNSGRHKSEEVQQWRDALKKVANFSGWHTENFKTDRELVDAIVDDVCTRAPPTIESTEDIIVFEATRRAMDQLMKALEDNNVTAVGVYGMGGVGKTTLVKHVGQEARKQGLFDHVIMGRVNQIPDLKNIQGMLADGLGIQLTYETVDGRASRLSSEIRRRNKTLIILDNVWAKIELSDIGIPTYDILQSCNSKVLLTTRRQEVCHVMRSQKDIALNCLSREDSWTLFVKHASKSFESTDSETVARKVARECGGLPIALIAVAREHADDRLEESLAANHDHDRRAYECIKLSYDFLKDEDSKSCFLLCCLFPEGYDIQIEDLFKYGIGTGLFKNAATIQLARREARSVAKNLIHSSLLLDSEYDGCVRMHNVIRDTAIQITQSEGERRFFVEAGCRLENWPLQLHEDHSAISLMKNDICKLPEELVCPKLQILLLQENHDLDQIPDTFFETTSSLRVVDLSYTSISSLSKSFTLLSNLKGLYLDYCRNIADISILKKCKKLEILSMKEYPLKELSTEIGNLTNLRVLDVSGPVGGGIIRIPSGVISKLLKLEEICLHCGFWDWGSRVEGEGETTNASFDEVTSLSYLNSLKVCISDVNCIPRNVKRVWDKMSWTCFDICIGRDLNASTIIRTGRGRDRDPKNILRDLGRCVDREKNTRNIIRDLRTQFRRGDHKYSRSLILDTTISMLPSWFVKVVTEKTERLVYVNFTGLNSIFMEYHHGRLHSLKHLSVIGPDESLKALILVDITGKDQNKAVFETLEELHVGGLDSLKELCSGELPSGSLFNLKVLEVRDCPDLENVLLPSKLLQRLANLENLLCKCMSGMEYVFGCEGFELEESKLKKMELFQLEAVKSICNGPVPPAMFQALQSLSIYDCNFLGGLFTFDVAQCLFQVENISVVSCRNLERVIEASKESELRKKTVLPKLKSLVLVNLPMLYSGGAAIDMECPSLQHLYVRDCPHFSASADDFGSNNKVVVNDVLHYCTQTTRLQKPGDYSDSYLEAEEKIRTMMESQLEPTMPNLAKGLAEILLSSPQGMQNMPKFEDGKCLENKMKVAGLTWKTPGAMAYVIGAFVKINPEALNQIPELMDELQSMDGLLDDNPPEEEKPDDLFADDMPMPEFRRVMEPVAEIKYGSALDGESESAFDIDSQSDRALLSELIGHFWSRKPGDCSDSYLEAEEKIRTLMENQLEPTMHDWRKGFAEFLYNTPQAKQNMPKFEDGKWLENKMKLFELIRKTPGAMEYIIGVFVKMNPEALNHVPEYMDMMQSMEGLLDDNPPEDKPDNLSADKTLFPEFKRVMERVAETKYGSASAFDIDSESDRALLSELISASQSLSIRDRESGSASSSAFDSEFISVLPKAFQIAKCIEECFPRHSESESAFDSESISAFQSSSIRDSQSKSASSSAFDIDSLSSAIQSLSMQDRESESASSSAFDSEFISAMSGGFQLISGLESDSKFCSGMKRAFQSSSSKK